MDESYGAYDDEYLGNHDCDGTDYDNDHKKDSYTAGAAPTQTRPGHARPGQAKPDPKNTICLVCFGMNGFQIGLGKLFIPSL